jgi:hypothetical protein
MHGPTSFRWRIVVVASPNAVVGRSPTVRSPERPQPAGRPYAPAVTNADSTAPATPTSVWVERGLGAVLTLCFLVALVLRINEPPADHRGLQFALLAVAVVAALVLVAVRPRQQAADPLAGLDAGQGNDHMSR